jgi:hypothetical protein
MRSKLLTTVAVAALIGGTSIAFAQGAGPASGASEQHGAPGGAMQHTQTSPGSTTQTSPGEKGMTQTEGAKTTGSAQDRAQTGERGTTEKNAQTQERGTTEKNAQTQERGRTEKNAQTQERGKTEQNAQTQERGKTEQNAQTQERGRTQENAQTQERGRTQENAGRNEEHPGNAAENRGPGGRSVQLSETQRTQIKDVVVRNHNVARAENVHFNIAVGTTVPHDVHVAVLPSEVVRIVPEYRGFDYVVVGDELLIIDPHTMEIVDIIPA